MGIALLEYFPTSLRTPQLRFLSRLDQEESTEALEVALRNETCSRRRVDSNKGGDGQEGENCSSASIVSETKLMVNRDAILRILTPERFRLGFHEGRAQGSSFAAHIAR